MDRAAISPSLFEPRLPFVKRVHGFFRRDELDACVEFLESRLNQLPRNPLHWLVGKSFRRFAPAYRKSLFVACRRARELDHSTLVLTSVGELEINYLNWHARTSWYPGFGRRPRNLYSWLEDRFFESQALGDWFKLPGLQRLGEAFELAWRVDDPRDELYGTQPELTQAAFTATCYLFFTHFAILNRESHAVAKRRRLPLGRSHLACYYGPLVYYSPPATTTM